MNGVWIQNQASVLQGHKKTTYRFNVSGSLFRSPKCRIIEPFFGWFALNIQTGSGCAGWGIFSYWGCENSLQAQIEIYYSNDVGN